MTPMLQPASSTRLPANSTSQLKRPCSRSSHVPLKAERKRHLITLASPLPKVRCGEAGRSGQSGRVVKTAPILIALRLRSTFSSNHRRRATEYPLRHPRCDLVKNHDLRKSHLELC